MQERAIRCIARRLEPDLTRSTRYGVNTHAQPNPHSSRRRASYTGAVNPNTHRLAPPRPDPPRFTLRRTSPHPAPLRELDLVWLNCAWLGWVAPDWASVYIYAIWTRDVDSFKFPGAALPAPPRAASPHLVRSKSWTWLGSVVLGWARHGFGWANTCDVDMNT